MTPSPLLGIGLLMVCNPPIESRTDHPAAEATANAAEITDADENATPSGTIAFSSLAPLGWDVYVTEVDSGRATRLTDHPRLDFNASPAPDGHRVAFVSERDGNQELYVLDRNDGSIARRTDQFALDDRPAWSPDGNRMAFSSTREPASTPGRPWNAVHVMELDSGTTRRLTPPDAADYSPAWSPKGDWIAVASGNGRPDGTDIVLMRPDGTHRRKLVEQGGWPSFSPDGQSVFFHSEREGNWGIWRIGLDGERVERITPTEVEAYTPSVSADGTALFAAVRRDGHRQIARIDLESRALSYLTTEATDHWNPAPSPDGRFVYYHRRSSDAIEPNVEAWGAPPGTRLQLLRVQGAFPAFSPDGNRIALTGGSFSSVDVMNRDGTDRRTIFDGQRRGLFSISWARTGDLLAFSLGPVFQGPAEDVELMRVRPDGSELTPVTDHPANDGFPSFSPDGQELVFRSGRDGSKNLYLMHRDGSNIRRLTEGDWTDSMADWSPDGAWIVFASDRDGDFDLWRIRPDGSGLTKVLGGGGRDNHPHYSPDGHWIVFTSQRAGHSAETITLPDQPQPYGDLFAIRPDGTGLIRLTHNGFEEGTPAWGPSP